VVFVDFLELACFLLSEKRHVMFSINRKRHVELVDFLLIEKDMFCFSINAKKTCYVC